MDDDHNLRDLLLTLENDRTFYEAYLKAARDGTGEPSDAARRLQIRGAARRLRVSCHNDAGADLADKARQHFDEVWAGQGKVPPLPAKVKPAEHEPFTVESPDELATHMSSKEGYSHTRYFARNGRVYEWRPNSSDPRKSVWFPLGPIYKIDDTTRFTPLPARQEAETTTTTQPKENPTMNAIEITTLTLVNGQDVAKMTDAAIYDLIAQQEAEITKLNMVHNKPKRLQAEIERREAGIKALVAYLDSKDTGSSASK